jgi:2'-5' RNA ligase
MTDGRPAERLRSLPTSWSHIPVPAIIDKLLRIGEGKILRQLEAISEAVNTIEDDFVAMSDDELREMTDEFRRRLEEGETLDDIMPEAFATVREAARRVLGLRPFDVQLAGCGAFPPSGQPRVFWIDVRSGGPALTALYEEVGQRLAPLGYLPERRGYTAHLTLARVKALDRRASQPVRTLLAAEPADCGTSRISAITLFRSRLSPRGAAYEPLLRVPLKG